jgi:hypothetical protein
MSSGLLSQSTEDAGMLPKVGKIPAYLPLSLVMSHSVLYRSLNVACGVSNEDPLFFPFHLPV